MDREIAQLTVHTVEETDGTTIVQMAGEIDLSSAPTLIEAFRAISAEGIPNMILDATRISFMDSTGLHALVEGKRMIHESWDQPHLGPLEPDETCHGPRLPRAALRSES